MPSFRILLQKLDYRGCIDEALSSNVPWAFNRSAPDRASLDELKEQAPTQRVRSNGLVYGDPIVFNTLILHEHTLANCLDFYG